MNTKVLFFSLICFLRLSLFSWSTPVQLSDSSVNFSPMVVTNSTEHGVAGWVNGTFLNEKVQVSFYNGTSWSAAETISSGTSNNIQVAIDGSDNAVAVWVTMSGNESTVSAATRPSGSVWSSATPISTSSSNNSPVLTMNSSGSAVAAWIDQENGIIQAASLTFGGSWSSPVNLSSSGVQDNPQIGIDSSGNVIIAWEDIGNGEIVAARRVSSMWGMPQTLVSEVSPANISLDVGSAGNAILGWKSTANAQLLAITFASGTWEPNPTILSSQTSSQFEAGSFGADGFLTWFNLETGNIQASNYTNGIWETAVDLSPNQDNDSPSIAVDGMGTAFIVWSDFTAGQVMSVTFPTGGMPAAAQAISSIGNFNSAKVAASSNLNAIAVWCTSPDGAQAVQANVN